MNSFTIFLSPKLNECATKQNTNSEKLLYIFTKKKNNEKLTSLQFFSLFRFVISKGSLNCSSSLPQLLLHSLLNRFSKQGLHEQMLETDLSLVFRVSFSYVEYNPPWLCFLQTLVVLLRMLLWFLYWFFFLSYWWKNPNFFLKIYTEINRKSSKSVIFRNLGENRK